MKKQHLLYLIVPLLLFSCNNPRSGKISLSHDEMMTGSTRSEKNGWIVVHLEGKPEVIGYQHGYLLADEIIDLRGAMAMLNRETTGKDWEFYRSETLRLFRKSIPEEYIKELEGIVKGVNSKLNNIGFDLADIVAMNAVLEMSWYYVPWLDSQKNKVPAEATPPGHCSAIAATGSWTRDGKIVMAHNNWCAYALGQRWNVILDIVPEKGYRMVMDALPGNIHSGDDFNINSQGLIVTETTITQFNGFDTTGTAEFVRARKAIQYSSTIDEWVAVMKEGNTGGYANDWLIGDNKTGEIARLELGLKNQFLERTTDGYFAGANYAVNEKLIREETTFDPSLPNTSPNARRARWNQLMNEFKGKIDVEAAKKFMGDHYDTWRKVEKPSGLTLCGHFDDDGTPAFYWGQPAFDPSGAVQGKATDGNLAAEMKLWAIIGHPCGEAFNAREFLQRHTEFSYQSKYLRDMPSQVWTLFGKTTE